MESEILKFICANTGSVDVDDLMSHLFQGESMIEIISNQNKFVLYSSDGKQKVVARTSLKLCRVKDCQGPCRGLHLCKNFLFNGLCYKSERGECSLSHDLNSDHNQRKLKHHELESLIRKELCTLLIQSDDGLLPSICHNYNIGDGKFGQCQDGVNCKKLHICEKFLNQDCSCSRNHNFNACHPFKVLYNEGVPSNLNRSLKSIYTNKDVLRFSGNHVSANTDAEDPSTDTQDKMLYRWQVQEGDRWTNLPDNETIEREYCDPNNSYSSGNPPVYFDLMTRGQNQVRRLSPKKSVALKKSSSSTEWLWYWQDEFEQWNLYGTNQGDKHKPADIDSTRLEMELMNDADVVEFTAGSHTYLLDFQDMIQINKHYGTEKFVRRRPRFVSAAGVEVKKVRKSTQSSIVPEHWDMTQIPLPGFSRISLLQTSDEFKHIQALFYKTMKGSEIISIERIQNQALWITFNMQKILMKKNNNGCDATEKLLFHGTASDHVDAICLNNFDWRICGTHGTRLGKGSYFAQDASYSHRFTGATEVKTMFISQVLVGNYTKGAFSYVRPPCIDGGNTNFYDSCVDDVRNPSMFVVFEKQQIYPGYLLQYSTPTDVNDTLLSVQNPQPSIQPQVQINLNQQNPRPLPAHNAKLKSKNKYATI